MSCISGYVFKTNFFLRVFIVNPPHTYHYSIEGTIATSEHLFQRNAEYAGEWGDGRGTAARLCVEDSFFILIKTINQAVFCKAAETQIKNVIIKKTSLHLLLHSSFYLLALKCYNY